MKFRVHLDVSFEVGTAITNDEIVGAVLDALLLDGWTDPAVVFTSVSRHEEEANHES